MALSLFPNKDILTKEIESWRGFADNLHADNRELFENMLIDCYKYAAASTLATQPVMVSVFSTDTPDAFAALFNS